MKPGYNHHFRALLSGSLISLVQAIFLLVCIVLFLSYSSLSFSANYPKSEVKKGAKQHQEFAKQLQFYDDPELQAYIERIGKKLVKHTEWSDLHFNFYIVDSPDINAFATQGGHVYMTRGILGYLNSEAQVAAVLAHEIAHNTRLHIKRRKGQQTTGNILSTISSYVLWNADVGEAVNILAADTITGFGRKMELEADEYGAKYLYRSGYDPQAIIETLSILKDHQQLEKRVARDEGLSNGGYHGVFASHPRNDKRLRKVIEQAGELPPGEGFQGRSAHRKVIDGLAFGRTDTRQIPAGMSRYVNKNLAIRFDHPDDWHVTTQGNQLLIKDNHNHVKMRVLVNSLPSPNTPLSTLENNEAQNGELINKMPLYADKARKKQAVTFQQQQAGVTRSSLIILGANWYKFQSESMSASALNQDQQYIDIAKSFKRATYADIPPKHHQTIHYLRTQPGQTFKDLSQLYPLNNYTEETLRVMNGYNLTEQPEPGTWIKVIQLN